MGCMPQTEPNNEWQSQQAQTSQDQSCLQDESVMADLKKQHFIELLRQGYDVQALGVHRPRAHHAPGLLILG